MWNGAEFLHKSTPKIVGIPISLHSDQVKIHDPAEKISASWKGSEHLRSRPWDMMKVPDGVGEADRSQLRPDGHQMIVVDPHEIARAHKFLERPCKCAINSQVAGVVCPGEIR